ncbi:RNA polymerase sigma-70 factor (ECF subfamily) [Microbacterium sp. SORGH_AS 505]|uniref:RNA polymerase sigma factor n=1 Tax=Microbacterium sp. SORGH_AS_0505 TaxID=3041770 RepID=UPI002789CB40|nr:RNA polymerase sigma factor [Microbacterium sp. SORGH_AS_0505]MDQ1125336.1 RNA polymerase sigma-70 factor (ECF subfamily) [Microbacterium sp. SORGH_AS_0505]
MPSLPRDVPDRILVERAIDGDAVAFGELLRRHSSLVRAYVYRIVGSMADTDDVVQDAFVTAWKQLPTVRDPAAFRSWLMRIAGREALAVATRRSKEDPLDEAILPASLQAQPERTAIQNDRLAALSRALDRLKEDQRRCWLLREVAELSYAEIAEEMTMTESTVRGVLARARASIAIEMEGWR